MRKWIVIVLGLIASLNGFATNDSIPANDTVLIHNAFLPPDSIQADSAKVVAPVETKESLTLMSYELMWTPDPLRATWLAVIIPGLGQIYNRSYWKLPIVYGGLMGCGFAIAWNDEKYGAYKQAYRDILDDAEHISTDPTRSYNAILPEGYTIERMGGVSTYTSVLKDKQNTYRRYRDISIVVGVLVYALSIIDAYVDAQLFDFDISDDLSINIEPQIYYNPNLPDQRAAELKLAISF